MRTRAKTLLAEIGPNQRSPVESRTSFIAAAFRANCTGRLHSNATPSNTRERSGAGPGYRFSGAGGLRGFVYV